MLLLVTFDDTSLATLKSFLSDDCDRKVTVYWTLISLLYCYDGFKNDEKKKFVNEYFGKIAINTSNQDKRDRVYWLLCIWYIDNGDAVEQTKYLEIVQNLLIEKSTNKNLTEFLQLYVLDLQPR